MAEADVISLKLREVLILDKRGLARGHLFVVKVLTTSRNETKVEAKEWWRRGKMGWES